MFLSRENMPDTRQCNDNMFASKLDTSVGYSIGQDIIYI